MTTTNVQRTLAQRLTEGRIPVSEALHYSMSLAEALRKLHDAGKAHGAVAPNSIVVTATGLELIPSLGPPATVTPYTAPEVLQGQPADTRSDIFSFGTLVFEMLTGRRAFDGDGQTALTLALCNSAPPASGSPAVDRLVAGCVAKAPAARWQRMQKIIMELKLLTVAARRADAAPAVRGVSDAALRSEIQKLEGRLTARLAAHESAVAGIQQAAGETVKAIREQLAGVSAELVAARESHVQPVVDVEAVMQQLTARVNETVGAVSQQLTSLVDEKVGAVSQQLNAHVDEKVGAVSQQLNAHVDEKVAAVSQQVNAQVDEKVAAVSQQVDAQMDEKVAAVSQQVTARVEEQIGAATQQAAAQVDEKLGVATQQAATRVEETVGAVNQRMTLAEQNMEEIRKHFATLQANVAGDLHDFEQNLKAQSAAIESARTAMAQTDDLVERVVEALELLQSSVLDQQEHAGVN
jgi:hypothetical protein